MRTIASPISHAWWDRNVIPSPMWTAAAVTSAPIARRWLRLEIPARRGGSPPRTGTTSGIMIARRSSAVHRPAETDGSVHAATSVATASGADRVRRRLSSIFQRAIAGIAVRSRRPASSCARPRIHGRSCQSPRAQRCCRATETR